ncbi:MAG: phenylalanine--tRNA ligase subunit beta, partial [Bacteroidales bacterium]|nr:phenylalanine--tRNA ligase subunit beta [Bacteroidales bacterium]
PEICLYALKRAALLLKEVAGAEIDSAVTDIYPKPFERAKIRFTLDYLNRLIGEEMKAETVEAVLRALEMEVAANGGSDACDITFEVTVPCNKTDVTRPADLVEEFLRIYGYNRISEHNRISYGVVPVKSGENERVQTKVSDYLSAGGFYEIMNNSLCSESYIEKFGLKDTVKMLNPLSREMSLMRTSLLFGGLTGVARNLHHKQGNIRFYEFGRTYFRTAETGEAAAKDVTRRYREENHLGMWLCGNRNEEIWQEAEQPFDFYAMKAYVEKLWKFLRLDTLSCKVSELKDDSEFLYGLRMELPGGKTGVRFGEVAPEICKAFDIKQKVFYADFDWDAVLKAMPRKAPQFREVNRFPEVRRDLALLVDKGVDFAQIEAVARKSEKNLLRKVSLFDVYEGK